MNKLTKILLVILGNILIGSSIGILKLAKLGVDPLSFMNMGFSNITGISIGKLIVITNIILVIVIFFAHKSLIGLGTLVNMVVVGFSADMTYDLIKFLDTNNLITNILLLFAGVNILSIGVGIYLGADLGASAYDGLPYVFIAKIKRKLSYKYVRIVLDCICIAIGLILKAKIGIGTIILGFFTGPLIEFYRKKANQIIYDKYN